MQAVSLLKTFFFKIKHSFLLIIFISKDNSLYEDIDKLDKISNTGSDQISEHSSETETVIFLFISFRIAPDKKNR